MRIAVLSFSDLDRDPRVKRQVESFLAEDWAVYALVTGGVLSDEKLTITRVGIERRRSGRLRYVFEYAAFMARAFFWVLGLALRERIDVVYVNSPPDILSLAAYPARLFGIRLILDVHDPMPELWIAKGRGSGGWARLIFAQESIGLRIADTVLTVHEPMRQLLASRNPGTDISVVMNVPDTTGMIPFPARPESRLLVFAGTVAFRYGLDDVARAMAIVSGEISGLRLRVIGEGEDLGDLKRLVAELGVDAEFVGRVPWAKVRAHQDGAWVGVNVPKPDALGELSFSNKVVEWVALGLPVLAARTSTVLTYFPEGSLEYVEAGSPESIADGLRNLHKMSEDQRIERINIAREALAAIAWPQQRHELIRLVRETAQSG